MTQTDRGVSATLADGCSFPACHPRFPFNPKDGFARPRVNPRETLTGGPNQLHTAVRCAAGWFHLSTCPGALANSLSPCVCCAKSIRMGWSSLRSCRGLVVFPLGFFQYLQRAERVSIGVVWNILGTLGVPLRATQFRSPLRRHFYDRPACWLI